jgi:S1-C subfamily serine protease
MKRIALYSSSRRSQGPVRPSGISPSSSQTEGNDQTPESARGPAGPSPLSHFIPRHHRIYWVVVGGLVALLIGWGLRSMAPAPRRITQKDVERAVLHTLETQALPSPAARAYEIIKPSVVRVRGLGADPKGGGEIEKKMGTGVVVVDKGLILTNLHVVAGVELVKVVFADGLESEAVVVGLQPENDLAVLQAKTVPDDLPPANLGSVRDLAVGDHVIAVGFPFGIGPSVSAGVISGLNREFRSPEGERLLTNLIQFDAAVNTGNSGGPLVNANGEVVGIVTAILNPAKQRVFIGIGFAVTIETAATAISLPPF